MLNSDKSSVAFIKLKHELYMDLFEHKLFKKSPEVFFLNYKHFTKFKNKKISEICKLRHYRIFKNSFKWTLIIIFNRK